MPLFRRRDPWWGADGAAATRRRRLRRAVAFTAFLLSLGAVAGAAIAWAAELGFGGVLGLPLAVPGI
jgi:hypothetical protein